MLTTDDIKNTYKKYALQNAVKYNKLPQAGSVMGKVMGSTGTADKGQGSEFAHRRSAG